MGRKSKYETLVQPNLNKIREWYQTETERQIAKRLGVSVATFENYKNRYPELVEALQRAKETLVDDLKATLKRKARGFTYEERKVTIFSDGSEKEEITTRACLPDVAAIHLLLKNLDDEWRNDDRQTMRLKMEKLELEKTKLENESW